MKEGSGDFGYNAATGQYGHMLEMGIIDPTKVTDLSAKRDFDRRTTDHICNDDYR